MKKKVCKKNNIKKWPVYDPAEVFTKVLTNNFVLKNNFSTIYSTDQVSS